mmetsp:Transcript_22653/g.68452  ORF Transcript_22653/g.68452 Transcript_22653/m.68452 type:complete len:118 (-) Transcript_22653:1441-1794(-)
MRRRCLHVNGLVMAGAATLMASALSHFCQACHVRVAFQRAPVPKRESELEAPSGARREEPVMILPADTVEPPRDGGNASVLRTSGACEPTLLWLSMAFQMFFMRISEFQAVANASRS